jgi:SPP1 gp7 family putative phage head morphogenesis protein
MSASHGDSQISYGNGEKPKYHALRAAIDGYYRDLLRPLDELRTAIFTALPVRDPGKAAKSEPFRYTAAVRRVIDTALDLFLTELAGPDRTREGFVQGGAETETPDGILQQRSLFAYAVGLQRGASLLQAEQSLQAGRQSPAVTAMLDHAFARLSEGGKLRLESVRDDIHSVLVSAQDAGLNPLVTARQLAAQFDQYSGWEFQRLARTEAAFAAEEGTRNQFVDLGVTHVEWLISSGACPICEGFAGQVFEVDDTDNLPPAHPNCMCSCNPVETPPGGREFDLPGGE